MPMASMLMQQSLMLPFAVALMALTCCFPVLAAVHGKKIEEEETGEESATGLLSAEYEQNSASVIAAKPRSIKGALRYLRQLDVNILLVLLGHLICPVRQELVFQILIPYTSNRFELPIAKVAQPFSRSSVGIHTDLTNKGWPPSLHCRLHKPGSLYLHPSIHSSTSAPQIAPKPD
jgi:hypothetical protein